MPEALYRQFLGQARRLAGLDARRPKQGNLRRAVSTAYYGLFHFLVDQACRSLLGTSNDRRPFRDVLARAFQHQSMANACKPFAGGALPRSMQTRLPAAFTVPPNLRNFAHTFRDAQEKRHLADYDLTRKFARSEVLAIIRDVEQAIHLFSTIRGRPDTKFFLACLLAWNALEGRR
jgi:uncharacterized protein (UPF0332 family)